MFLPVYSMMTMLISIFLFQRGAEMTQSVGSLSSTRQQLYMIQHPLCELILFSFSESCSTFLTLWQSWTFKMSPVLPLVPVLGVLLPPSLLCPSFHCWKESRCSSLEQHEITELKRSRKDSWAQIIEGLSGFWGEDKLWMHKAEYTGVSFLACEIENHL